MRRIKLPECAQGRAHPAGWRDELHESAEPEPHFVGHFVAHFVEVEESSQQNKILGYSGTSPQTDPGQCPNASVVIEKPSLSGEPGCPRYSCRNCDLFARPLLLWT